MSNQGTRRDFVENRGIPLQPDQRVPRIPDDSGTKGDASISGKDRNDNSVASPPKSLQESLIPCQFACPLQVNVPEMLHAAAAADWAAAWRVFETAVPLPFCTACLCRGECKSACHPDRDEPPVDICRIERTSAENAPESSLPEYLNMLTGQADFPQDGLRPISGPGENRFGLSARNEQEYAPYDGPRGLLEPEPRQSACAVMEEAATRVAVVGGSPAALAAAYHLAVQGYKATVFSSERSIGGWLQTAVAGLRLPLKALNRDMRRLRTLGVAFEELPALDSVNPGELREIGYDAVIVAPEMVDPARRSALVRVCFRGLVDADAFVQAARRTEMPLPGKIVVLGTGFDSAHVARLASARGCPQVTLAMHSSPYESPVSSAELHLARDEGVEIVHCDLLQADIRRKEGCLEVRLPQRENGISAEMILLDGSMMPHTADDGMTITLGPAIPPSLALDVESMLTDTPGVFAIDPIRLANHSIAEESALGRRAADAAREFLTGHKPPTPLVPVWKCGKQRPQGSNLPGKRKGSPMTTTAKNNNRSTTQEAARCTECNLSIIVDQEKCTGCLLCIEACPAGALYATDETGRLLTHPWRRKPVISVDRHLCEKCGTCIETCPHQAIALRTLVIRHQSPPLAPHDKRNLKGPDPLSFRL